MKPNRLHIAAAALLVSVGGGAAVAASAIHEKAPRKPLSPAQLAKIRESRGIPASPNALANPAKYFGVLRSRRARKAARSSADQTTPRQALFGVGGNGIVVTTPQGNVTLRPGPAALCITTGEGTEDVGGTCQTTEHARNGYLIDVVTTLDSAGSKPRGSSMFVGMAPDGVSSVTVTQLNGVKYSVPVRSNVYSGRVSDQAQISFASGSRTITRMLPGTEIFRHPVPPLDKG